MPASHLRLVAVVAASSKLQFEAGQSAKFKFLLQENQPPGKRPLRAPGLSAGAHFLHHTNLELFYTSDVLEELREKSS